nr:hypothetical protein [Tanacetum cinerariifolium]
VLADDTTMAAAEFSVVTALLMKPPDEDSDASFSILEKLYDWPSNTVKSLLPMILL